MKAIFVAALLVASALTQVNHHHHHQHHQCHQSTASSEQIRSCGGRMVDVDLTTPWLMALQVSVSHNF